MKRLAIAVAIGMSLAACGSSSNSSNAASSKAFNYGAAQTPTATEASAVSSVSSSLAAVIGGTASSATGLMSVNASGVLGADFVPAPTALTASPGSTALQAVTGSSARFVDSSCYTETDTSATFKNCTIDDSGTDYTFKIVVDGSASLTKSGDSGELKWNLKVTETYTGTGSNAVAFNAAYTNSADLKGTRAHIEGSVLDTITFDVTSGGSKVSGGIDESLDINVDLADTCSSNVVGGTLEAKRVWTARPSSDAIWSDKAVKVTWSACDTATIQKSL